jgi:hypothetical protein
MPSPFPGMDPFIESSGLWPDFHLNMLVAMRAELNRCLPERYFAGINEYQWTDGLNWRQRFIEIRPQRTHRTVGIIELLTPLQKQDGPERRIYLARRERLLKEVNLVEIDLLRSGERVLDPILKASDYCVYVTEGTIPPSSKATIPFPFSIREPLPPLLISLPERLPTVPGFARTMSFFVPLDECLARVYDEGRYGDIINYNEPLTPPLSEDDAAWAKELLRNHEKPD